MADNDTPDRSSIQLKKDLATAEHDENVGAIESTSDLAYGVGGIRGLFRSWYVFGSATLASLGGFSMGYDMGVISIINVMDQFHAVYPRSETAFGKGLMTGMLLLGAFVGCLFMSYLADRISRKWAITVVVVIFDLGAILQTAAVNYDMLVAGRFIGGIGVGTLAMVRIPPPLPPAIIPIYQHTDPTPLWRVHPYTSPKHHPPNSVESSSSSNLSPSPSASSSPTGSPTQRATSPAKPPSASPSVFKW